MCGVCGVCVCVHEHEWFGFPFTQFLNKQKVPCGCRPRYSRYSEGGKCSSGQGSAIAFFLWNTTCNTTYHSRCATRSTGVVELSLSLLLRKERSCIIYFGHFEYFIVFIYLYLLYCDSIFFSFLVL